MEVKQSEMTTLKWEEMKQLVRDCDCAECGFNLDIYTIPERQSMRVGCVVNKEHRGFKEKETYTQTLRRGGEVLPAIRDKIERKALLPGGYDMGTALAMVKTRFPRAKLDDPSAALFITDCVRLDLDPFLGEIVPSTFYDSESKRFIVVPIITEDGYLSMAARACPEIWNGPPKTMRLEDYLMTLEEHKGKPYDDIQKIAKDIKKSLVKDENAELYYAIGRSKGQTADVFAPGWFKSSETTKKTREGEVYETIGGQAPGNQARVRAIKRFVREVYPESKAKMREMTAELLRRAEGFDEVKNIIEGEYHIVTEATDETPPLIGPPGGQKALAQSKAARTKGTKKADNKVGESAERVTAQQDGQGGEKSKATPSAADEHTLVSDQQSTDIATAREAPAADKAGFISDLPWVYESLKFIHWSIGTARSWITSEFKIQDVASDKEFETLLSRLIQEQAKRFCDYLHKEVDKRQNLFK